MLDWHHWSAEVFTEAAAEHHLVLVHVGAVWCHWCHVMEDETYGDPRVQAVLAEHYEIVKVDQDARPDVSQRYEDWGWPATVLLAADGTELAKLRGYVPPERFVSILEAFVADPTPGPSAVPEREPTGGASRLDPTVRAELLSRWDAAWDDVEGGWGRITKALDGPSVDLSLAIGTDASVSRARRTLAMQRRLVDPVWGGVYQYSDSGDWDHPHFEKIAPFQADDLRAFALGWAVWGDPADRTAALAIHRYVDSFLRAPTGGYAASQDADLVPGEHAGEYFAKDDAGRRALGVPRVDPHQYAVTAGQLAAAMADASGWLRDDRMLADAVGAAEWAIRERSLPGGGFRHDVHDDGGPWLADTLAMGEAFLALYTATADPGWLDRARQASAFVDARFRWSGAGYRTSAGDEGIPGLAPLRHREENARVARFGNTLFRHTGDPRHRAMADHAMTHVAGVPLDGPAPPALLADRELVSDPLHVVVVGGKDDPRARALYAEARAIPVTWRKLEWCDPATATTCTDVALPSAFVCAGGVCSPPVTDPAGVKRATRGVPPAR